MLNFDLLDGENEGELRGYLVWHGLVEDVFDPLKMGRVRARIIGWHSLDRGKMPTNTLPWAFVAKATTGSNQSANLQLNDWVTGFFLDGYGGQKPVIIGKYDGITPKKLDDLSRIRPPNERTPGEVSFFGAGTGSDLPGGYEVDLTDEQKKMLRSYPKPALNIVIQPPDRPSNPPLSQGIVNNTAVGVANKNRVHVCDISAGMKRAASAARAALAFLMKGIRAAVKAILKALGFAPDSESGRIIELAKMVLRGIQYVRKFINIINDFALVVVYYAKQVRAMIDWILSLPKILAAMLAECLNELLNAAAAGFAEIIAEGVGASGGELSKTVTDLIDSSQKLINDTTKLLTVPGQVVEALATPSTPSTMNAMLNTVLTFTNGFSTSNNSISNIQRP